MVDQQPQPDFSNYYNPQPNQLAPDILRYRLDAEDLNNFIRHDLMGEDWIGNKWIKVSDPWCNDAGIAVFTSTLSSYFHRGIFLGNLNKWQIDFKCKCLFVDLSKIVFSKYRVYSIDPSKRSLLVRKIVDCIHLSLSRTEDGMESSQLSTSSQRIEHVSEVKESNQHPQIMKFFRLKGNNTQ